MERAPGQLLLSVVIIFFFAALSLNLSTAVGQSTPASAPFPVGVVLDFDTLVGKMSRTCIRLAIEDFYAAHPKYTAKLQLHERDSNKDVVDAASEALDLLKNEKVQAILGPLTSSQAEFVLRLGSKSHVPIVSFSATSPSLSPAHSPYFIRAATNDSSQVSSIAAILDVFGWKQVVPIYEDTVYGTGIVPYLVDAFQDISARIPYRSVIQTTATKDQIKMELYKLKSMSTRVFVVHMSPDLASLFFLLVREVGMMEAGYVWLITDGLTDLLDSLDPSVIESMQGVLGVRPYVPRSKRLNNFTKRWRVKFRQRYPEVRTADPSLFCLWAYDTIWALAIAAERVKHPSASSQVFQSRNNSTVLGSIRVSKTGPILVREIMKTRFRGLSGDFVLVDGQLLSSAFQIINVNGKRGREVAFWTPFHGISRRLPTDRNSKRNLEQRTPSPTDIGPIIWPGEAKAVPKAWEMPTSEKKLRVGVPVKDGFTEFVKVETDPVTSRTSFDGYCINVFDAVIKKLPYAVRYEYIPFANETGQSAGIYDELVLQVTPGKERKYDVVVGDTTILGDRALNVDFTLPFTDSGWSMLVRVKEKRAKSTWDFLKPLSPTLWVVSFAFFLFTGIVVWFIEHSSDNHDFHGSLPQQLGKIFYFAFSTMVFSHRADVKNNFTRFVVVVWIFVVLILQSSFTASLASLLTVKQLEPSVADVNELLSKGQNVGYQHQSFVGDRLKSLGFDAKKIFAYDKIEQYEEALSKGTENGGVSAIFDEIPYNKVFLSKYCVDYTMAGPIYKTDGFGFVFPRGSPMVSDISRAILNVTEGDEMRQIENKWFGKQKSCPNLDDRFNANRLTLKSFQGLFLITGGVSVLALLLFLVFFNDNDKTKSANGEQPNTSAVHPMKDVDASQTCTSNPQGQTDTHPGYTDEQSVPDRKNGPQSAQIVIEGATRHLRMR